MIIFCNIFKKYVFQATGFRVYWSKRGHYTASSAAAGPGYGNGEIEAVGDTPGEAVINLRKALTARREALQAKLNEVEEALQQVRDIGHKAQDLTLLPKEGEIKAGNTK